MRFVLKVNFPVETFNAAVRDGSAGKKLNQILDDIKPEAAYFWADEGKRGGFLIVQLKEASQIPSVAEPWMLHFDASIELRPCMTPEDLASAGLDSLAKKYG